METSFWHQLPRPIFGLSPMDGVTDQPFRHIIKKYGQPALMYTEFTSVEGLCHGASSLLKDFLYDETQRPIIGQIYGSTPEYFRQASIILCELGFDGIDINMGCPAKNVAHSGAGAALIKTPDLAQQIIAAVKLGIQEWKNGALPSDCADITPEIASEVSQRYAHLPPAYQSRERVIPISVKTRVGYYQPTVTEWIPYILEMEPVTVTVHGRTLKQQYSGLANWEEIAKAAELAHQANVLLLGNGDVKNYAEAQEKISRYGVDGVLIGRAAMGNPYVFHPGDYLQERDRFAIAVEHAQLYEATYNNSENYNFLPMRKHLGWYVRDIPNASDIRIELFKTNSAAEVSQVLANHGLLE